MVFVFGLMGWLRVPIYLTLAVTPVLLTAMCVTEEIHFFGRYLSLLRQNPGVSHVSLIGQTIDQLVRPIVNTSLTTVVGFVSFAFSPLPPVQAFGIFTGLGVLFSLFYSLTVLPAMLTLIDPKRLASAGARQTGEGRLAAWFSRFASVVVQYRYGVIGILIIT